MSTFPFEALLVVDMQMGFVAKQPELRRRITDLVAAFPDEHLYFTHFQNFSGSLFETELDWGKFKTSEETALAPEFAAYEARSVKRNGYLLNERLLEKLGSYRSVALVGVDTDVCMIAMSYSLWDQGIRPFVLADYCASCRGDFYHQNGLNLMIRPFGMQAVIKGLLV